MKKEESGDKNKDGDSSRKKEHEEHSHNKKSESEKEFNTPNTLIAVVIVLVIMSGVQVFQTQQLLAAISNGAVKTSAPDQESSSIGLPSQVGGCG